MLKRSGSGIFLRAPTLHISAQSSRGGPAKPDSRLRCALPKISASRLKLCPCLIECLRGAAALRSRVKSAQPLPLRGGARIPDAARDRADVHIAEIDLPAVGAVSGKLAGQGGHAPIKARPGHARKLSVPCPSSQSITLKTIPRLSISASKLTACFFHSGVSRIRKRVLVPGALTGTVCRQSASYTRPEQRRAIAKALSGTLKNENPTMNETELDTLVAYHSDRDRPFRF
jgi:hypothetical protein